MVTATGDGLWGPIGEAAELARVGKLGGTLEFGAIQSVVALPNGGAMVFDAKGTAGPTLILLDSTGRLIKVVGRRGAGPGEYGSCMDCLRITSDQVVWLYDSEHARFNRYRQDGSFINTVPIPRGLGQGAVPLLVPGAAGTIYVRGPTIAMQRSDYSKPDVAQRWGYVRLSSRGDVLDTVQPPAGATTRRASSAGLILTQWLLLPDGRIGIGRTDSLALLVSDPRKHGSVTRFSASARRAEFGREERAEMSRAHDAANNERKSVGEPTRAFVLPKIKPAFKAMIADVHGRIWFERATTAVRAGPSQVIVPAPVSTHDGKIFRAQPITWLEPLVYAAFRQDGSFLG